MVKPVSIDEANHLHSPTIFCFDRMSVASFGRANQLHRSVVVAVALQGPSVAFSKISQWHPLAPVASVNSILAKVWFRLSTPTIQRRISVRLDASIMTTIQKHVHGMMDRPCRDHVGIFLCVAHWPQGACCFLISAFVIFVTVRRT